MKSLDPGILPQSVCFSFTPSDLALQLYFYPIWCGHYFCTSNYFMKRNSYPPLLLAFIRKGFLNIEYRGQRFTAQKGDVVLLDCHEPHYYHAENGLEFLYIHFDGSNSHEICQHILATQGPLIRNSTNVQIGNLLYDIIYFYVHDGIANMVKSSLEIYKLLQLLQERTEYNSDEESPIELAIRYIRNNVGKKISLGELADIANLSTFYFSHQFKEQTGFSPTEYVINTRIDQAKILLARTNKTISEIAYEVGYASSGSLINLFVQKVGCSPKEFRKTQQ